MYGKENQNVAIEAIRKVLSLPLLLFLGALICAATTAFANPVITNPISNDTLTGSHCTSFVYDFDATGSGTIVFSLVAGPGTMNPTTGSYYLNSISAGYHDVTIRALDAVGPTDYSFTIHASSIAPTIINCPSTGFSVNWPDTLLYDFNATDPDPCDAFTWSVSAVPSPIGSYSIDAGGAFQFTPDVKETTQMPIWLKVTASDGNRAIAQCDFPVYVFYSYANVYGYKYMDVNDNKQLDGTDTPLSGWPMQLYQNGVPVFSSPVMTQPATGQYIFPNVGPGTYEVRELFSPWQLSNHWAQILPYGVQQTVTIGAPGIYFGPDFLNDSCESGGTTHTYLAGGKDNFASPEPAYPSEGLEGYLGTRPGGVGILANFDETGSNDWFGHTFSGLWSPDWFIYDAQLCLKVKATGDVTANDGIALGKWAGVAGGHVWASGLSDLVNVSSGTPHDGSWDRNDEMTLCLNFESMPGTHYPANIIAALQDGDFDVWIGDDTEIDYLELIITFCCTGPQFDLPINTAFDFTAGTVLQPSASETKDPEWVVGVAPNLSSMGYSKVVDPYLPAWLGPLSLSNWLTPTSNPMDRTKASSTKAGTYVYEYAFCVDPSFSTGYLNMDIRTDNEADVYLNSTFVTSTQHNSFQLPAVSISNHTSGFVPGSNVISVVVTNDMGPVGLDISGSVRTNTSVEEAMCCQCYADGDINGDGITLATADMTYLAAFLGGGGSAPIPLYRADLNGDCFVDSLDLLAIKCYMTGGLSCFPNGTLPVATCCTPTVRWTIHYVPGDANGNGAISVSDVVYLINYIFGGGPAPTNLDAADANCDGRVSISDCVYLIAYIFGGGPAPEQCKGSLGKLQQVAGEANLSLTENASEDAAVRTLLIDAHTDAEIAGAQLEFTGVSGQAEDVVVRTTERSKNLQVHSGIVDGLLKVGLIDLAGKSVIPAGDGPILKIASKNNREDLALVAVVLCDRSANGLNVTISTSVKTSTLPTQYSLSQNYPNPFNPSTEISFALPKAGEVTIEVINLLGQSVKTLTSGSVTAGYHQVIWDGTDRAGHSVSSGVYFYRIIAEGYSATRKMVLLK